MWGQKILLKNELRNLKLEVTLPMAYLGYIKIPHKQNLNISLSQVFGIYKAFR